RREKVVLGQGYSPLDWARLKSSGADLRGGVKGVVRVSKEELSKHNTETDAWTVLGNKVYNITPYLKFHPGGVPEIMRCAGKDGTKLFNYTHSWVNYDMMLQNCFIGPY
ncbi:hypothetical protein CANCADRAFT_12015, partial [Tortispora caseinolytica NRRL Y-17796]